MIKLPLPHHLNTRYQFKWYAIFFVTPIIIVIIADLLGY